MVPIPIIIGIVAVYGIGMYSALGHILYSRYNVKSQLYSFNIVSLLQVVPWQLINHFISKI